VSFDMTKVQPVPRIAAASRINFLAGLVTIEDTMLALIDLRYLLSFTDDAEAVKSAAAAA
jgi:purine-binding chemotaxis protein CheW